MSTTQPPDETQQAGKEIEAAPEAEMAPVASSARSRTWAHGVPAMRMQRARWRLSGKPATAPQATEGSAADERLAGAAVLGFPPHIRLIRAAVGVVLLLLAWSGSLAVYLLARATFAPLSQRKLLFLLAPRLAEGLSACLLAIVVAALLLVGAFAISQAVHPSDPKPAPLPSSAVEASE